MELTFLAMYTGCGRTCDSQEVCLASKSSIGGKKADKDFIIWLARRDMMRSFGGKKANKYISNRRLINLTMLYSKLSRHSYCYKLHNIVDYNLMIVILMAHLLYLCDKFNVG